MHTDCFAIGELKPIVRDPILFTVYIQLYKSLRMWEGLCGTYMNIIVWTGGTDRWQLNEDDSVDRCQLYEDDSVDR